MTAGAVLAELDDYLDLARAGPSLSDEQHIYHKLIFDAVNEAINECIMDVRCSLNCSLVLYKPYPTCLTPPHLSYRF